MFNRKLRMAAAMEAIRNDLLLDAIEAYLYDRSIITRRLGGMVKIIKPCMEIELTVSGGDYQLHIHLTDHDNKKAINAFTKIDAHRLNFDPKSKCMYAYLKRKTYVIADPSCFQRLYEFVTSKPFNVK